MVTSVHLAKVGLRAAQRVLRRGIEQEGLTSRELLTLAPLGPKLLPAPTPGSIGLVATWRSDDDLDAFRARDELFAGGYFARLEPVRIVGAWPPFPALLAGEADASDVPAAVLTLGRVRPSRALGFLRASARAERDALASPALTLSTGMARVPGLVATFSVWDDVPAMRAVVAGAGHGAAMQRHAARPFHRESAFIRFSVREQAGSWT